MSIEKVLYRAKATSQGGREGTSRSDNGVLDVKLTTPKELGGNGATGTNPEQLFAAGYSACFLGALKFVAGRRKLRLSDDSRVTAAVGIGQRDDGAGFGLDVALSVSLPGVDAALASELIQEADVVCPYSHLARTGLDVRLSHAA